MLLCELPLYDWSDCMQYIPTRKIEGRCDLCLPCRFLMSLLFHDISTCISKLNPCICMDAVIDTVVTGLITAGHPAVCCIYDSVNRKSCDISLPEIYARLDLFASYDLSERVSIFLRGENLTNARYEEVKNFGTAGRSVYAGLRATW